jgi:hypothetical protein
VNAQFCTNTRAPEEMCNLGYWKYLWAIFDPPHFLPIVTNYFCGIYALLGLTEIEMVLHSIRS